MLPKHSSLSRVVVQRANIGFHLLPPVVGGNQARTVSRLCQPVQHPRGGLLAAVSPDQAYAPAFIKRNPADQTWVVKVAVNEAFQRMRKIADALIRKVVRGRHLAPYQQSESVRPVIVTWVLQLLVLPRAVKAKLQCQPDILLNGLIAGRGQQRIGPIALIQHQPLV